MPSFSNFTDFDSLRAEPGVDVRFVRSAEHLAHADIVILPGSKQTVSDLAWMRQNQLDQAVRAHAGLVVGICGGMQMLGQEVTDPSGVEQIGSVAGLGLLPIHTTMQTEKVTRLCSGTICDGSLFGQPLPAKQVAGYEIHVGKTLYLAHAEPFATLSGGEPDGCISADRRILGTYLHGLFDDDRFRHQFLQAACCFHGLTPPAAGNAWKAQREESLDRLAREVSTALDMRRIFSWVGLTYA